MSTHTYLTIYVHNICIWFRKCIKFIFSKAQQRGQPSLDLNCSQESSPGLNSHLTPTSAFFKPLQHQSPWPHFRSLLIWLNLRVHHYVGLSSHSDHVFLSLSHFPWSHFFSTCSLFFWSSMQPHWVGPSPLGSTYLPSQPDTRPFLISLNPFNSIVPAMRTTSLLSLLTPSLLYLHLFWVAKNSLRIKSENQANWIIPPNFIIAFNASW